VTLDNREINIKQKKTTFQRKKNVKGMHSRR